MNVEGKNGRVKYIEKASFSMELMKYIEVRQHSGFLCAVSLFAGRDEVSIKDLHYENVFEFRVLFSLSNCFNCQSISLLHLSVIQLKHVDRYWVCQVCLQKCIAMGNLGLKFSCIKLSLT